MKQIVLDTETTGISPSQGHRIVEIGCVEIVNRKITGKHYQAYINPQYVMGDEVMKIHGITNEFLQDKPLFSAIADKFFELINGSELIIHNAPFDLGFINNEFKLLGSDNVRVEDYCSITDTLVMARSKHPGQKNNLDALCKRYQINNSSRTFHGALLDSQILAEVYLAMTGGQRLLSLGNDEEKELGDKSSMVRRLSPDRRPCKIIKAAPDELERHQKKLAAINNKAGTCLWSEDM
ncbi:MAG: DNA polymerase III subunit epsilon [Candidatus Endonucleobacter bathymodioli]|uniref:DNA polymerase III subunit epsilon n=1 Tax=Candidatus Endonucleibacter bathymodioli TaxID=539814 RepID=A0AA90STQ3_9GAMM|nr:DNA polymerase III subunit epsilon [Candidatus Endonucleobacter bathymodioli]